MMDEKKPSEMMPPPPQVQVIILEEIVLYSARRLIGSRIIESAAYCNQILLAPMYINNTQYTSVNCILLFLLSLLCWPKAILLSGGHCILCRAVRATQCNLWLIFSSA
jgi:hypothetical protein